MKKNYLILSFLSILIFSCSNPTQTNLTIQKDSNIVFISDRDGDLNIYSLDTKNNIQKKITSNKSDDFMHSVSKDGSKITFISKGENSLDVYVIDIDGSNIKQVTNDINNNLEPVLSPDNQKVLFTTDKNIYISNVDGSEQKRLTNTLSDNSSASFSNDGKKIVFKSSNDIYMMDIDGNNLKKLNKAGDSNGNPKFSPDDKKIAYISKRENKWNIYILDLTTNAEIKLTDNLEDKYFSWSPNGKKIAFITNSNESSNEINIINSDGSGKITIDTSSYSNIVSWSNDGNKVVYSKEINGNDEIIMFNFEDRKISNLTNNNSNDLYPKI